MDEELNGHVSKRVFSMEQKEKIQQLRERVLPSLLSEQDNEDFIAKWLIARKFDLDKAEDMLKKHIRFLKAYGYDSITCTYDPPEPAAYIHTALLGYDKYGSVVRIFHMGACDIRGLCLSLSKYDCIKFATHLLLKDYYRQKEEMNSNSDDKQVYIIDFEGLTWRTIVQRIVVERAFVLLKSYEANHPERLKIAYLVNVPTFFSFVYNWLKTVLPESIISKLEIIPIEECQSKLTKNIDPSILPAYLGGTRKGSDGDETCQSLYKKPLGELIPEAFLPADQLEALKNDPEAKKIIVEYKSTFIIEKVVKQPNSVLLWDFQTVDYDIRMGFRYRQDEDSKPEDIIPPHRVDSHIIPEAGKFNCVDPGIYELVFDNTYSWMTNKELLFKINVVPPKEIN